MGSNGIVDQHVEPAAVRHGGVDNATDIGPHRDVAADMRGGRTDLGDAASSLRVEVETRVPRPGKESTLRMRECDRSSPVLGDRRADLRTVVQRRKALFAAVTGFLHAAEGQLDAAARSEGVDVDLARLDAARHAQRPVAVP